MKVLTKEEQLTAHLIELNSAISYAKDEVEKAYRRKARKNNWGLLSFIFDPFWLLEFTYNRKLVQWNMLEDYRDIITEQINKIK